MLILRDVSFIMHDVWVGVICNDPYVTGPKSGNKNNGIKLRNGWGFGARGHDNRFSTWLSCAERRVISW